MCARGVHDSRHARQTHNLWLYRERRQLVVSLPASPAAWYTFDASVAMAAVNQSLLFDVVGRKSSRLRSPRGRWVS